MDAPKNDHDFYGLRYAEFVVPLVKAMQEQQQMIKSQNESIENLKQENLMLWTAIQDIKKKIGME